MVGWILSDEPSFISLLLCFGFVGWYTQHYYLVYRKSDFNWVLVAVYGAAQPEFKESFLAELVWSCRSEKLPLCIGGISVLCGTGERRITITLMKGGLSSLT
jgi:hypothetical protein